MQRRIFCTPQTTYVVDSDLCLGRRLHEGAVAELTREIQPLVLADNALVLQVALVPHQHHWHVVSVLKSNQNVFFTSDHQTLQSILCFVLPSDYFIFCLNAFLTLTLQSILFLFGCFFYIRPSNFAIYFIGMTVSHTNIRLCSLFCV